MHDLTSPRRRAVWGGLLITVLLTALLLWLKHGQWLAHPNDVMLTISPDGFKNYMASAWHVRYDSTLVHYGGMNYPFGDHVLFTDNQPIISSGLQWWNRHISSVSDYTIGILNIIQVLSLILGAGVIYLLLRKLHLPVWYAVAGALVLTFLAPQYNRFSTHFGLSHTFVIPLILYWLCRYEERKSRRYPSLHIAFIVWFSAQLHFYYLGMSALFLSLYIGWQVLRDFSRTNILKRLSHWIVMVVAPFVLLNIWLHWSDYAADRTSSPYGFIYYRGYWEGVFLPYESMPLYQWIDSHITPIREIDGEAKAYTGAIALFYTLWLLFSGFKMFGKTWTEAAYHRTHKEYLKGIFFAAFALLLFACGFPFAIPGMEWIVDYMGPLRQFRGLGRFTWAYFYVINILILYGAWNWGQRFDGWGAGRKFPQFKYVIIGLPIVFLAWEAFIFQKNTPVDPHPNSTHAGALQAGKHHWIGKVNLSGYQAILPLPYYHIGSENIWKEFDADLYRIVSEIAHQTGLPDMGVNMSRTPVSDMIASMQLVLEPGEDPAMFSELPDNRPLLLVSTASLWASTVKNFPHLLSKATMLYEDGEIKMLRLRPEDYQAYIREYSAAIVRETQAPDLVQVSSGSPWRADRAENSVFYQSFDEHADTRFQFQGKGAITGSMADTTLLWSGRLPSGRYVWSLWIKTDQDNGANHDLHIVQTGPNGQIVQRQHEGLRFYLKSIVNGWGLFELPFDAPDGADTRIFLYKKGMKSPFYADELLIRPADLTVYRGSTDWAVRNNYWYRIAGE